MNRHLWLSVEQFEREIVDIHHKAIGFSGPVLAEDDPTHGDAVQTIGRLKVRQNFRSPRRFWKIVLIADDQGQLKSAAFLLNQELLFRKDGVSLNAKPSDFRCTVADIESLTRLNFGPAVRDALSIPES